MSNNNLHLHAGNGIEKKISLPLNGTINDDGREKQKSLKIELPKQVKDPLFIQPVFRARKHEFF
jgi:hypothetical protein